VRAWIGHECRLREVRPASTEEAKPSLTIRGIETWITVTVTFRLSPGFLPGFLSPGFCLGSGFLGFPNKDETVTLKFRFGKE
jgi:hypothetical protein